MLLAVLVPWHRCGFGPSCCKPLIWFGRALTNHPLDRTGQFSHKFIFVSLKSV